MNEGERLSDPEITKVEVPRAPRVPRDAETRDTDPVITMLQILEEVRSYRAELTEPGKSLDKLGSSLRQEIQGLRQTMDGSLRLIWSGVREEGAELRDMITALSIHQGLAVQPSGPPENVIVLIVDDDPQVRKALVDLCRSRSMTVYDADGSTEAERVLNENQVDVVLTDLAMPRNGVGLAEFIRTHHAGVEVILMSAYPDLATKAEEAGAFFFLKKPFDCGNDGAILMIKRAAERRYERRHPRRRR